MAHEWWRICWLGVMLMATLAGAQAARVLQVTDYGARPNTGADATPAIRAALAAARRVRTGPVTVQFAPGRYRCAGGALRPDGRTHAPSVESHGLRHVTIDGNGATLAGCDIARLFVFQGAEELTIRNLTIDWDPLPHTSGRVVRQVPEVHAVDIAPQIPVEPQPGRIVQAILAYDPARRRLATEAWEIYQTQGERDTDCTQRRPEGYLRVFQRRDAALPPVGMPVVVRHQVYGYDAFTFAQCRAVTLEDVTVHAAPGMAVIGLESEGFTIRRLRVAPAEGGWMSVTADAMHFNACRGRIIVEDSTFAGMGDDAINIHAMYGMVTERPDAHTLVVARARLHPYYDTQRTIWSAPEPGDVLEYGGGDEPLLAQGQLHVTSARQDARRQRTIIRVRAAVPAAVGAETLLSNLSTTPSVRINRCTVRGNRARGFLLQTRDVVVVDCTFEDVSAAGIQLCTDAAEWWESLGSRDVTIQRCTFRRCNFGVARRAAALDIFADLPRYRPAAAGVHQRIRLLENVFEDNAGAAMQFGSCDGVEARGNRVIAGTSPAIIIQNSRNVALAGNILPRGRDDVVLRGSTEAATVTHAEP